MDADVRIIPVSYDKIGRPDANLFGEMVRFSYGVRKDAVIVTTSPPANADSQIKQSYAKEMDILHHYNFTVVELKSGN